MKIVEFRSIVKLSSVTLVLLMLLNIVFWGGINTAWANEAHDHTGDDVTAVLEQDENHDDHISDDVTTVVEQDESHDDHINDNETIVIEQDDPHDHTSDEGTGFTVSGEIYGITEGEVVELKLKKGDGTCQDIILEEGEVTYNFKNVLPDDYIICVEIDNVTVGMIPIKVEDSDITEDLYIKQINGMITGLEPGVDVIITLVQPDIDMEMVSGPINLIAEDQELNYSIKTVPGSYYLKVFYPDYGEYLSEEITVGKEDCTLEPIEMVSALRIATESLPEGTTGFSYTASLEAEAVTPYGTSPYNWEISSGSLPPGLQLETLFGKITGIPLQAGNFSFDIRVKNLYGYTAVKPFLLDISSHSSDDDDSTGETDNHDFTEEIDNVPNEKFVPEFTDIKGHWAYNNILEMAGNGFIQGYEDKSFRPEANITRAEFATILVKILRLEDKADLAFKDVLPDQWYFESIAKAYRAGIIKGYTSKEFRPNEFITREQIAVMTAKAMIYAGIDLEKIGDMTLGLDMFADKELLSNWAKESVVKIARANITKGVPLEGQIFFYPNKKASRAEAVVVLLNLIRLL